MENKLTAEERMLTNLLSKELLHHKEVGMISENEWKDLLARVERHHVFSLLYDSIEASGLPKEEKQKWKVKAKQIALQNYHLLFTAKFVIELLEKNNIPCVLLKGAAIAEYFPVPELRKSGDVDILVLGKENMKKTAQLLLVAGFQKSREQHASHHVVWFSPEGIELELHTKLVEQFSIEDANRKVDRLLVDLASHIQWKELMGINFPVLSEGFQAYHLLLHMLVHYLHSGFGLRLLCDWVVFWNNMRSVNEKAEYRRLVKESGLQRFSDIITSVCIHFLGLPDPQIGMCVCVEEAEVFLKEVLMAEEFGNSDTARLVVLQGTGWWEYVKEFHHQMKMNYPKWAKVWIFWPVLWICTLVQFIKNNHNIRRTSSWQVLKKTHERSQRIKELQLFQIK